MKGHNEQDVAIIGMACRTAGGKSSSELWETLMSNRDIQSGITRFNTEGYYDTNGGKKKGVTNVKQAYTLPDEQIHHFDHAFFQIPPNEARCIDLQQRHLLEVAFEAVESAGIPIEHFKGSDTAVFAGMEGSDYASVLARDPDETLGYAATGVAGCMAANRISYFFDLSGASMTVDTACSSSMTAMHQAMLTLQAGESGIAVVCGAKMILTPDMFMPSSEMGFLSPDGSASLSMRVLMDTGEAKPLKDAVREGGPIRAVVKGTRVNQDGRTKGITLPSSEAQAKNTRDLYAKIRISADSIQYVEAHGTGTAAGDPLEVGAVNRVFNHPGSERADTLIVGSVTSSIGHLESAAALAGVMEAVLCLEHRAVPPKLHFIDPNPKIDFSSLVIPIEPTPLHGIQGEPLGAAVNCFGAGGTNGHCVLEEYLPSRAALVDNRLCWIFTGQGAQWPGMGTALLDQKLVFSSTIRECEDALSWLLDPPDWSISDELRESRDRIRLYELTIAQPVCTALQLALDDLWRSWGMRPLMVVGHSSGEIAAAYAAGFLTLRDAIVTAYLRGLYCARLVNGKDKKAGAMCAVGLGEAATLSMIEGTNDKAQLAAVNSPSGCTLSGDMDAIDGIVNQCLERVIFARKLRVDVAYHSHHVLAVAKAYENALAAAGVTTQEGTTNCRMYSSVTGGEIGAGKCSPAYWKTDMTSTVRFSQASQACAADHTNIQVCFEVGPHPTLAAPATETLKDSGITLDAYYSGCDRGIDDFVSQLHAAGALHIAGMPLDMDAVNGVDTETAHVLTDLPTYPWNHSAELWWESRISKNIRFKRFRRHPLLGSRYWHDTPSSPSWRCVLDLRELEWLPAPSKWTTKCKPTDKVLSHGALILMALEAARQLQGLDDQEALYTDLKDLHFDSEALLDSNGAEAHFITAKRSFCSEDIYDIACYEFQILLMQGGKSSECCSGKLSWGRSGSPISWDVPESLTDARPEPDATCLFILENAKDRDLDLDPGAELESLWLNVESCRAENVNLRSTETDMAMEPRKLEAILQLPRVAALARHRRLPTTLKAIKLLHLQNTPYHQDALLVGHFTPPVEFLDCFRETSKQSQIFVAAGLHIRGIEIQEESAETRVTRPLRSLFYKSVSIEDLSAIPSGSTLSLKKILNLVRLKWPMCDIACVGDTAQLHQDILTTFDKFGRPSYRSLTIDTEALVLGDHHPRVRSAKLFDSPFRWHLITCTEAEKSETCLSYLKHGGLLLVPARYGKVGSKESWVIRRSVLKAETASPLPLLVFQGQPSPPPSHGRVITPDPDTVAAFCSRGNTAQYDAVVYDSPEKPVACTWPGSTVVTFMQELLARAHSITWITHRLQSEPFAGIAGSFLRTIQSERPSLKVQELAINQGTEPVRVEEAIRDALRGCHSHGDNELRSDLTTEMPTIRRQDSLNAPYFGYTLERLWSVMLQCSDPDVAARCPTLLSGWRRWGSVADCQCLDR